MDNCIHRESIKLSASGLAGIAMQFNTISAHTQQANGHLGKWDAKTKLNWDAFLELMTEFAK